jgi:hypothetical protein
MQRGVDPPIVALSHEHPEPQLAALQREVGDRIELFQDPAGAWLKEHGAHHADGHPSGRGGLARPHLAWIGSDGVVLWSWRSRNYRKRLEPDEALAAGRRLGLLET